MAGKLSIIKWLEEKTGMQIAGLSDEPESKEYAACRFLLDDKKIIYRESKITPTKTGQFVTAWKRNNEGITTPFDTKDDFDFLMITAANDTQQGVFIFPKQILLKQGIISDAGKGGKRGFRLYTLWDEASNKQAVKTQQWQVDYFTDLSDKDAIRSITKLFEGN